MTSATKTAPAKPEVDAKPSLTQAIAALQVGESHPMCERMDGDQATKEWITETREKMRNFATSAITRVKAKTGGTYRVEGGEIQTRSLDLLCVVAITRME